MNFAYIDTRHFLDVLGGPPVHVHVEPTPCTLDASWTEFEKQLANFKKEYAKTRAEYIKTLSRLQERQEEINVIKIMTENVTSDDLRGRLNTILVDFENHEALTDLTEHCSELAGRTEAMKKALLDTNADRYGKFTCFVCMDRLVDLFIDPCGHVICESCWTRTQNKDTCPGCRTRMIGTKRIFSLS
jgi:rubrerythrin